MVPVRQRPGAQRFREISGNDPFAGVAISRTPLLGSSKIRGATPSSALIRSAKRSLSDSREPCTWMEPICGIKKADGG